MLFILKDGSHESLPRAVHCKVLDNKTVHAYDASGNTVATYSAEDVLVYGREDALAHILKALHDSEEANGRDGELRQ